MRLWWKTDFLTQVSSPPGRGGPRGRPPTCGDRSATAPLKFSLAKLFPPNHRLFCLFRLFWLSGRRLGASNLGKRKRTEREGAEEAYCKSLVTVNTEYFWGLAACGCYFLSERLLIVLFWSHLWAEVKQRSFLWMRPLTGLEERVSYVHFWLELLLRGCWSGWVGGFSEPVTTTRSPQSSTGLLSRRRSSPPPQPRILSLQGRGWSQGFFVRRAAHFFSPRKKKKKERRCPSIFVVCLSIHIHGRSKKTVQKCDKIK